jgi:hypothetical protein
MARGRPLSAGILIGLLTFKPHLGLLIPFALVASPSSPAGSGASSLRRP